MNIFDSTAQQMKNSQTTDEAKKKDEDKAKYSASKLQQMVNTLIVAKTPTGANR